MILANVIDWLAGDGRYMTLYHCMGHDKLWVAITVSLDLMVGAGYGVITLHWWQNARNMPDVPARRALASMRNIFLFCCICGYMFIPIKMFWPAWRLYDCFMAVLVYFTWRYAWNSKNLKVVYSELGKTAQLTAELEESKEHARRKTAFLNAISHDLRTPLNGIALQSEVAQLSAMANDPVALKEALEHVTASARAAAELLDSLLECARLDLEDEPSRLDTFSLADAIRASMARVQPTATQKGLYLEAVNVGHILVNADRRKLERILDNLLANAVKFTDSGGIRIAVDQHGPAVEVQVIDSGVGLSLEQQQRLFEEFYQVGNHERDRTKGFGLGLSIARRLARQIGGDISVQSAIGRGSRFTVALSAVVVQQPVSASAEPSLVAVAG